MVTWNSSGAESELELLLGNRGSEVVKEVEFLATSVVESVSTRKK